MHTPNTFTTLFIVLTSVISTGCSTSIKQMGTLGPKKLQVYTISENDFLSSNHMLVVLNKKGEIAAYTGGTVSGPGTLGLQTGASIAEAGAIVYGANTLAHGVENSSTTIKGIPHNVSIKADGHDVSITSNK